MSEERKSASQIAKDAGLPSLNSMQELTGIARNTLDLWNKTRPQLFDVMVAGCVALFAKQEKPVPAQTTREEAMAQLAAEFPDCSYQCPSDKGRCICRERKADRADIDQRRWLKTI